MRQPLRCYLLRPDASPVDAVSEAGTKISTAYRVRPEPQRQQELDSLDAQAALGTVFAVTFSGVSPPPWWVEALSRELDVEAEFAVGGLPSRGALVFCAVTDPQDGKSSRWLVWSFGIGSRYLERRRLEPRFGVITALNRIIGEDEGETRLRKFQYQQPGAFRQRVGHVAASDTPLGGFRFDRVRDLVAAAGGRPTHKDTEVFGSRNYVYRTEVDPLFGTLAEESASVLRLYRKDNYRRNFAFIDNYLPVDDPDLVQALDNAALDALLHEVHHVEVWYPDDLIDFNDETSIEYVLLPGERLSTASRTTFTVDFARKAVLNDRDKGLDTNLRFADADRNEVKTMALRECLTADFIFEDDRYVLTDGTYYLVDSEFLEGIDQHLESVPSWNGEELPDYEGKTEPHWIRKAATGRPFLVLDRELIQVPGTTPFEPADLLHASGAMLHVKRRSRSSSLAYCFVQASTSAEMLTRHESVAALRAKVEQLAAPHLKYALQASLTALDNNRPELPVVITLLSDRPEMGARHLPLIAKLELESSLIRIHQQGFRPYLNFVPSAARR